MATLIVILGAYADRKKREFGMWITLLVYAVFIDTFTAFALISMGQE